MAGPEHGDFIHVTGSTFTPQKFVREHFNGNNHAGHINHNQLSSHSVTYMLGVLRELNDHAIIGGHWGPRHQQLADVVAEHLQHAEADPELRRTGSYRALDTELLEAITAGLVTVDGDITTNLSLQPRYQGAARAISTPLRDLEFHRGYFHTRIQHATNADIADYLEAVVADRDATISTATTITLLSSHQLNDNQLVAVAQHTAAVCYTLRICQQQPELTGHIAAGQPAWWTRKLVAALIDAGRYECIGHVNVNDARWRPATHLIQQPLDEQQQAVIERLWESWAGTINELVDTATTIAA